MIRYFSLLFFLIFPNHLLANQFPLEVKIVGSVYCQFSGNEMRPAKGLFIEALEYPSNFTLTKKGGSFELVVPFSFFGKDIVLNIKNNERDIHSYPVTLTRGSPKKRNNVLLFFAGNIYLDEGSCSSLETLDTSYYSKYRNEKLKIKEDNEFNLWSFLDYARLITIAPNAAPGPTRAIISRVEEINIPIALESRPENGRLFDRSRNSAFRYFGFRYSLGRTGSNAIITNPSTMAFESGYEIHTNFETKGDYDLWSANARFQQSGNFGLAVGYYRLSNENAISYNYGDENRLIDNFSVKEHGFLISTSYKMSPSFALGVSTKYLSQEIDGPSYVSRITTYGYETSDSEEEVILKVEDITVNETRANESIDFDISAVYEFESGYSAGITLLDVAGDKNILDNELVTNRGAGVGFSHFGGNYQIGIDIEYTEQLGTNTSFGGSYLFNEEVEFSGGYHSRKNTFKLGFRFKGIFISIRSGDEEFVLSSGGRFRF